MIDHLKYNCDAFKMYKCDYNCGITNKMSIKELREHYEKECLLMQMECIHCKLFTCRESS